MIITSVRYLTRLPVYTVCAMRASKRVILKVWRQGIKCFMGYLERQNKILYLVNGFQLYETRLVNYGWL